VSSPSSAALGDGTPVPPVPEDVADQAAPLDALLVDAALGPLRRFVPNTSTARFARGLARRPGTTGRRLRDLVVELAKVAVGTSALAPSPQDRRFADPAWAENPILRRLVRAYLATEQTAERLVADAGLCWSDEQRVRFLVDNVVEALSPSNMPVVNPASAKAVIDTAGLSLVRGGSSLVRDLASAPRVPQMVDPASFQVGRNIAMTPGAVVLRTDLLELIQYRPQTEQVREVPLLIAPPTINKYYALDLAPGRSLVEYLVQNGQQVFVISWRNPDARHAGWGIDTYVQAVLDALDEIQRICAIDRAALFGFCSGGIIASLAAAYLAGTGQQTGLAALGLGVTVLDFADAGVSRALVDRRLADAAKARSRRQGYLDGRALAEVFAWLRPADLVSCVRHIVLERRHDADERWAARRLRRPCDGKPARQTGCDDGARRPCRPVPGRSRHLRRRRDRRPSDPLAELLPRHPADRRRKQVRPVYEWSHRGAGQPAGQTEGQLPGQPGPRRRRRHLAEGCRDSRRQLVAGRRRLAGRARRSTEANTPPPW
jgi:hypothetical protein